MQGLITVLAAVVCIAVGYWLRHVAARSEKAAYVDERARLGQRSAEIAAELTALRGELTKVRELAEGRAGFESLCAERQGMIDRLTAERDEIQSELRVKIDSERLLGARISQLEADLRNERENSADKVAIVERAEKSLADQFQVLAGEILEQKSKTFAEASQ